MNEGQGTSEVEQKEPVRKLTVYKTTYGVSKHSVIGLNYNDGGENILYPVTNGSVDSNIFNAMIRAQARGFEIEFKGFDANKEDVDNGQ